MQIEFDIIVMVMLQFCLLTKLSNPLNLERVSLKTAIPTYSRVSNNRVGGNKRVGVQISSKLINV